MLTCVCIGIARACRAHRAGAGTGRRGAGPRGRCAAAGRGALWAPRGPILDRTGQTLALSFRAVTVGAWPSRIPDRTAFAQALSTYTHITPAVIEQRMGGSAQYVFVARRLEQRTWTRIKADPTLGPLVKSRAIEPEQEPRRIYPNGGLAAQVVGVDGTGLSGVEFSRNEALSARDGLALGLEGQRPADRRCALGARPARARASAGQAGAAHA